MPDTTLAEQTDDHPTNKLAAGTNAAGAIGGVIAGVFASYGGPAIKELIGTTGLGAESQNFVVLLVVTVAGFLATKYGGQRAAYNVLDKPNRPVARPA